MRLSQITYKLAIISRKKSWVLWNLNVGNLKKRVFVSRANLQNKSEDLCQLKLSGKLFISESMYHENHQLSTDVVNWRMQGKSTLLGSGIMQQTSNLVKELTLSKFFILLTLKNFLALTIWMILLTTLHFNCSHLLLCCAFHFMFSPYSNNFL